jgi:hypothetical protein
VNLTDNQARLRDALPTPGQDGAIPAALAEATGLGYSTVTRLLRELVELDAAVKDEETGLWHATTEPSSGAGDVPDPDQPTPAGDPVEPEPEPDDVVDPEPDPAGDPVEPDPAPPTSGDEPGAATGAQNTVEAATDPEPGPDREPAARMRKGALRDLVLAALRDAAGQPLGPTELSHRLGGRSQGAIANACDALVATGHAVLTSERPRRFAATTS